MLERNRNYVCLTRNCHRKDRNRCGWYDGPWSHRWSLAGRSSPLIHQSHFPELPPTTAKRWKQPALENENSTWRENHDAKFRERKSYKEFHVGCRMVRELNATNRMLRRQWNYGRQGSSFLKVGRRKDDAFPLAYLRGPISQPRSELCGASVTNNLFLENCRKHMFKWKQSSDDGKIEKKRSKRLNDF